MLKDISVTASGQLLKNSKSQESVKNKTFNSHSPDSQSLVMDREM